MSDGSEWTPALVLIHIKEILSAMDRGYQSHFESQEKAVTAALAASEKAVLVAERNSEKWRDNADEWRSAISEREKMFCRQSDHEALKERLDKIEGSKEGKRDLSAWTIAGITVILAIIMALLSGINYLSHGIK